MEGAACRERISAVVLVLEAFRDAGDFRHIACVQRVGVVGEPVVAVARGNHLELVVEVGVAGDVVRLGSSDLRGVDGVVAASVFLEKTVVHAAGKLAVTADAVALVVHERAVDRGIAVAERACAEAVAGGFLRTILGARVAVIIEYAVVGAAAAQCLAEFRPPAAFEESAHDLQPGCVLVGRANAAAGIALAVDDRAVDDCGCRVGVVDDHAAAAADVVALGTVYRYGTILEGDAFQSRSGSRRGNPDTADGVRSEPVWTIRVLIGVPRADDAGLVAPVAADDRKRLVDDDAVGGGVAAHRRVRSALIGAVVAGQKDDRVASIRLANGILDRVERLGLSAPAIGICAIRRNKPLGRTYGNAKQARN